MQPTVFLSHGGGPAFFMEAGIDKPTFSEPDADSAAAENLRSMVAVMDRDSAAAGNLRNLFTRCGVTQRPSFIIAVSAHWEESTFTVQSGDKPALYFDYHGFPDHTYELQWPAPGAPGIAKSLASFLDTGGLKNSLDSARGYDHGAFIPLMLAIPEADIPVLEVSLSSSLDVEQHIRLGKALGDFLATPEGRNGLLIGSGQMTANLSDVRQAWTPTTAAWAKRFVAHFDELLTSPTLAAADRERGLLDCASAPEFSMAHPRTEHFLPLIVAAAASGYARGRAFFEGYAGNVALHCYTFGAPVL